VTVPEKVREQRRKEKLALEADWGLVARAQWLKC
jgi:hypothetical protein